MTSLRLRGGKLAGWTALVSVLALLNYASRAAGGRPPRDFLYEWSTSISGFVQYAIMLAIVLAIARGAREALALRRPPSWRRAALLAAGVLVLVYAFSAATSPFLHPGREQGFTPSGWDPSRAAPFALNFAVFALVAPFVEELTFRGLGFALLRPLGRWPAILLVGLAFGLAHGLLQALPVLVLFGVGLAYLRSRTGSVLPGIVLHGLFNAISLVLAVVH